jgi:hypothetical protein
MKSDAVNNFFMVLLFIIFKYLCAKLETAAAVMMEILSCGG